MKTNLYQASRQWSERPPDERFWNLTDLYEATKQYAQQSVVKQLALNQCEIVPTESGDLLLTGPEGGQAQFQHYSFGQFANMANAPAAYLRGLPAPLAAANLNYGMSRVEGNSTLLFHQNGGLHLRAVTSDRYSRIWNYEIAELALALEESEGWRTPPARPAYSGSESETRIATAADVLRNSAHPSLGIKVGDTIGPAGLYASDHDCFIFQVNEDKVIDGGNGESLYRGVFWSNSEVGAAKFRATLFLYESICGNHIVWAAKTLAEVSIRHTGEARRAFSEAMATISERMNKSAYEDESRITRAKQKLLGDTEAEVISFVFRPQFGLSKTECENAYVLASRHSDEHGGNPNSAWGFAAGVTRLSQSKYADDRDRMDRSAGRILETAF